MGVSSSRPRHRRVRAALRATPSLRGVPSDAVVSTVLFGAARAMDREIEVRGSALPGAISAVWLSFPDREVIEYAESIPLASGFLGILHEIGHMLCGHGTDAELGHGTLGLLAPSISPELSQRIVRRGRLLNTGLSREEAEAEWYARTMYRRALRRYAMEQTSLGDRAFNLVDAPRFH